MEEIYDLALMAICMSAWVTGAQVVIPLIMLRDPRLYLVLSYVLTLIPPIPSVRQHTVFLLITRSLITVVAKEKEGYLRCGHGDYVTLGGCLLIVRPASYGLLM
jgi:hypothetical protein